MAGLAAAAGAAAEANLLSGLVWFNEETLKLLYVPIGRKNQDGLEGHAGGKHSTIYGADNIIMF